MKLKHSLTVIGWMGTKTCYLDVPREDAIRRFLRDNPEHSPDEVDPQLVEEFEFDDEFHAYSAWAA